MAQVSAIFFESRFIDERRSGSEDAGLGRRPVHCAPVRDLHRSPLAVKLRELEQQPCLRAAIRDSKPEVRADFGVALRPDQHTRAGCDVGHAHGRRSTSHILVAELVLDRLELGTVDRGKAVVDEVKAPQMRVGRMCSPDAASNS